MALLTKLIGIVTPLILSIVVVVALRWISYMTRSRDCIIHVTDLSVTLACKVSLGLQDLQKRGRRILAERNTKKDEENTWIGRMVVAESIEELNGLIRSCAA